MRWLSAISCRATHVKYSQLSWRVEAKCQSVVTLLASFDAGRRVPVLSIWCIAGLKHSFSNPSHRSVLLLQDWLHGFPGLAGIGVCRNCRYDDSECTARLIHMSRSLTLTRYCRTRFTAKPSVSPPPMHYYNLRPATHSKKGKGSPYSIAERRIPELITCPIEYIQWQWRNFVLHRESKKNKTPNSWP